MLHKLIPFFEVLIGCISAAMAVIKVMASRRGSLARLYGRVMISGWTVFTIAAWLLAAKHIGGMPRPMRLTILVTAGILGVSAAALLSWGIVLDVTRRSRTD